ncbi:MAG TPA: hypothetical protein DIT10_14020 [Chryseobacterium sp.]|uniref:hypothetical protein n=1 Tax=Chryseobacterium lactis TaxID=1241981 RepID=UPI000EC1BAE0|nr:hypothetical protein [Chryseobacterium lactis]HCN50181.1 hypothetical protein [Chryseobacterium sp.]
MKKLQYILMTLAISSLGNMMNAQIKGNQGYSGSAIPSSSAFIDASVTNVVNNANFGKGMIYPRADLSVMVLSNQGGLYNASNNPNRFDGMIVYNTATTGTAASGATQGTLSRGFWYYDNSSNSPTGGTWRPFITTASDPKFNVTNAAAGTPTNTLVNGNQVYAIKGQFTASGTSTAVDIPAPAGMSAMYGITIYKAGTNTVYDRSLYSYTVATSAGNAITGSPSMSVVYPNGVYEYVLEYLK